MLNNDMFRTTWMAKQATPRTVIHSGCVELAERGPDGGVVADVDIAFPAIWNTSISAQQVWEDSLVWTLWVM